MADRALIEHLVAGGAAHDDAVRMADLVLGAIHSLLTDGKTVGIPNVGRLTAPTKPELIPGPGPRRAAERGKVRLRYPATIQKGESYGV